MKTSDCPTVLIMCLPVERFPLFPHIFGEAKWRSIHILKSLLQSLKSHCSPLKDLSSKWSATDTFSCLQTFCCPRSQLFVYDFTYSTCNLVGYQHLCVCILLKPKYTQTTEETKWASLHVVFTKYLFAWWHNRYCCCLFVARQMRLSVLYFLYSVE